MTAGVRRATPYDELRQADGRPREAWTEVFEGLDSRPPDDLARLRAEVDRLLEDDGVSYRPLPGREEEAVQERPAPWPAAGLDHPSRWRLDPLPLVVDADAWSGLELALLQRARLLDLLLQDIYGEQTILHQGLVDPQLVYGHAGYLRPAHGARIEHSHQLFLHGLDVVRGPDGAYLAAGDRTEAPSGIGYAMADRRAVSRVLPEEFARTAPHGLAGFFRTIRRALESVAPTGVDDPRVVLLSPGTFSETAFDQAFLAAQLGIPFVGSADLTVREGRLWMRALGRLEPVDVVLRRVDSEWSDPLDLRTGSRLGVAGLREMTRRGSVTVVNPLGSGVLESMALRARLPELCRLLLGEDLLMDSVPTYWCGEEAELSHVKANLAHLQLQALAGGPVVKGWLLSQSQRTVWRERLHAERGLWAAQEMADASVAPSAGLDGVHQHAVGMRLFCVAQQGGYAAMRGALGRVFGDHDPAHPTLTAAKDVWVRTRPALAGVVTVPAPREETVRLHARPVTSPRAMADLFWLGRYSERAEDLVRLMLAIRARADDFRYRQDAEGADVVPVLLGVVDALVPPPFGGYDTHLDEPYQPLWRMRGLMLDADRPGSVRQSLNALGRAAAAVRDQLSVETWIVLASVERALDDLAAMPVATGPSIQSAHTAVLTGMLALSGLAKESMIRDAGWHMMDAGRRVERAQQLTSLLKRTLVVEHPPAVQTLVVESVLSVGESIVTHRRRYGGQTDISSVYELLLLDPVNPRSLTYQLNSLADDLRAMPGASGASRPERRLSELLASLRRTAPGDLAAVGADGRRTELAELLDEVHEGLRDLADLVASQYFWHQVEMQPLWGPVGAEELVS